MYTIGQMDKNLDTDWTKRTEIGQMDKILDKWTLLQNVDKNP